VDALGFGQQLHKGDQDAEGLGEQGESRVEFDIHDRIWVAPGILGRGKGGGAIVNRMLLVILFSILR
jgi:hypothetical protein